VSGSRSRPARDLRPGLAVVGAGILAIALAQWLAPLGAPPLYDGVTTVAPYLWLLPPAGSAGGAMGAEGTAGVDNGKNRLIAIATPELQPQAQLFATPGTFSLPKGTTSIKLSIVPILPETLPADGHIEGNVYRISVTNQAGTALVAPASAEVTVGLRGPYTTANQVIAVNDGSGWRDLKTDNAGFAASYLAVVTGGGEYAMVAPGTGSPYPTATPVGGPAAGSAPASAGSSAGPSSSEVVPSIGEIGGSAAPSSAPVAIDTNSGGGPPVILIVAGLAVALVAVGIVLASRNRRRGPPPGRPPRYEGAHRR